MMLRLVAVLATVAVVAAGPMKVYEKAENDKYQKVLIPISSTVIPLDDLPVYKVGVGFQAVTPAPGKFKPDGPTKLITIHSLKRNKDKKKPGAALIQEVTQEEYKLLNKQ